ncbi:DNA-directed primase/polymerase protein isoform X6 [Willisornis vidua]|uniref:DNA-directed primase/polymerase protein n=1 Tax=Willisornis vidua TaxID=1566151 RepID=A0ABQ9DNS4_9PASS|nr:DNA-directed primase/polymerase protein isoform X6 [Willisornis vidua]
MAAAGDRFNIEMSIVAKLGVDLEYWLLLANCKGYKTSLMHCYEVIPEKDACKLYFDLEFYKPANPGADGKSMVAKLIELISQKLKELYDVNCSTKDVLNLDSSTDEKFSRHLIFLPQKTVFKDNKHVGNFVRTVLQPAIRLMESEAAAAAGIAEEAGHVFQCSVEAVGLDGSVTNLTADKDASKGWPAIVHQTKDMEMSHQGENFDFSFLVVNGKEGDKQLFVDLDSMEGHQGSPYPEIDHFVHSLVNKDGLQGGFPLPPGICLPSLFKEEEEYSVVDERGDTEEKVKPHSNVSDSTESSVSLAEGLSQDFLLSDSEWENANDDACFLEAAEDVELAEAASDSLNYAIEEIPDEALLEALRKEDTCNEEGS